MDLRIVKAVKALVVLPLALACVSAVASEGNVDWKGFRISGFVADQKASTTTLSVLGATTADAHSTSFSALLAWVPTYYFNDNFAAKLNLGGTVLKNSQDSSFFVADYEAILSYGFLPFWSIEAQGGAQTWTSGNGGTKGVIGGNLVYSFPKESFFSQTFVGYSRYMNDAGVNEIKFGLGLNF